LFVILAACSGGDDAPAGGQDGGGSGSGSGSACDPVTPAGQIIHKDHDPGAPPTMTGGTITDGVYALTQMVQYNGENGDTGHKDTMVFAGGHGQIAGLQDGTGPMQNAFFDYTTSGNDLMLTLTCGGSGSITLKYTATATTVTTVNNDDPNELHTFTKM
jgi:hypothetical protein